ncbi:MAG: serine/threonine-protein kinase, partial [Thermoanaerobaculia bacterium]
MIGSKLGSYEVEEEIGRGGMGVVYRANQPNLQRRVAVKVLLPHLAQDAEFVERFLREARAAAKLHHPGLVTIFDVGEIEGTYYFSMQWLQGKTLEEKLEEPGLLPVAEVVGVISQMAAALGYAHEAGVVHRDVKPANVIVDDSGRAVLTDFGIAQAGNETRLTRIGASVGSPDYMAPEQISPSDIDPRTDLYSLGVLFHHLLTGEPPYTGDAPIAVAYQHLNAPVPSVREKRPEVPPALDAAVVKLMAKAPEDRFQSADALLAELRDYSGFQDIGTPTGIASLPLDLGEDRPAEQVKSPLGSTLGKAMLAILVAAVIGGGLYWGLVRGSMATPGTGDGAGAPTGGTATLPPTDPEPAEPVAQPFSAELDIQPDLAGLEIWLDGRDEELTTPAVLEVEGNVGDVQNLELRRDGEVLASLGLTLGPEVPDRWAPALAPAEETLTISSEPAGALVELDGTTLEGVTPLVVALLPGRDYQLRLSLEGHEPAGWSFGLEGLSTEQRESGSLHFVLEASVPPAELVVLASYPVTVEVAGRRRTGEGEIRLSVPPGSYTVELSAPQVFYGDSRSVVLESDKSRTLELPRTVTIPVAAEGRCRLSIDGREVGDLPARVELT